MRLLTIFASIATFFSCNYSGKDKATVTDILNHTPHLLVVLPEGCNAANGADGSLEGPVDLVIRGRELIILNWDRKFGVNEAPDKPFMVSVINLQ